MPGALQEHEGHVVTDMCLRFCMQRNAAARPAAAGGPGTIWGSGGGLFVSQHHTLLHALRIVLRSVYAEML